MHKHEWRVQSIEQSRISVSMLISILLYTCIDFTIIIRMLCVYVENVQQNHITSHINYSLNIGCMLLRKLLCIYFIELVNGRAKVIMLQTADGILYKQLLETKVWHLFQINSCDHIPSSDKRAQALYKYIVQKDIYKTQFDCRCGRPHKCLFRDIVVNYLWSLKLCEVWMLTSKIIAPTRVIDR